ncbi:MAG: mycofactocin-coupled SDR family oxidoreductase [Microcella pacifica]
MEKWFSSRVSPGGRVAVTRSGSPRKAPTSSVSTCSNRLPGLCPTPRHRLIWRRLSPRSKLLDRRIIATKADVRSLEQVKKAVDDGVAELGRLDVVLANAGVSTFTGPTESLSEEAFTDLVDINLNGVWRTCAAAIPHIKTGERGGSIIMTSSAAGLTALANLGHYVAAKHGVVGLMRALALELAPHKIRVNSIHPTTVDTPMVNNEATFKLFRPDLDKPGVDDFLEAAKVMNALPVGWVQSVDISNAMVWLASDEARYVTGVTLPVDAGMLVK